MANENSMQNNTCNTVLIALRCFGVEASVRVDSPVGRPATSMGHDQLDPMTRSMQCSVVRQYYLCSTVVCVGDDVGDSSWSAVCLAEGDRTMRVQLMPKFWSGGPGVALRDAHDHMIHWR